MSGVQWFPGHMTKTKRLIRENLKRVDLIIEVLDARAPFASANPLLREITAGKPRVLVLNKEDLADPAATAAWIEEFRKTGDTFPIKVSASKRRNLESITRTATTPFTGESWASRRPVRALIAGIPNVGKSTIINALSRRRKAEAGATPGLTKDLRRIPVNERLELFDTPGLLWHKFEDRQTGIVLAALGAVKESVLPEEEVARGIVDYLSSRYPGRVKDRYSLEDVSDDSYRLVEAIGRRRGCLVSGGGVDMERTCVLILKDIRDGRLGRISLEWPDSRRL